MVLPISNVRKLFPALQLEDNGRARIYADNPAGTQVPESVGQAILALMMDNSANLGGHFVTSKNAESVVEEAHRDAAEFLGATSPREIIIGQSMTSLTFHLSRSICRDFEAGDEILITRMEHEGNVGPWLEIAKDKRLVVKWLDFNLESWQVEPDILRAAITDKTKLVCLNFASNMTGSINDIKALTAIAKDAGAMVFVDAVQLAPHHLIDVQTLGCDFLVCSSYKFFGPHLGIFWGREDLMQSLHPYKGRCVSDDMPDRFEAGTPQIELLAGLSATFDYFVDLGRLDGPTMDRRAAISTAFQMSRDYEEPLTNDLITGLLDIKGISIFGITNPNRVQDRVPTISIRHVKVSPSDIAKSLADQNIFVWHGHNYAYEPTRFLKIPEAEGVVRIGLAHYNTQQEVESILAAIGRATSQS